MKIQLGDGKSKKDNSLALLHGEAASSSVETAGCAYQAPSVIAAGATPQGVALLSSLTNLVLSILLIKVPSLTEGKQSSLKRTALIIATVSAITWLPIVFVMFFVKNVHPLLLTALWIIGLVPTTILLPFRDNWLAGLIPAEKMGRYLSWRSVIAGACYLATFYLMGFILDKTVGFESQSYAFILSIAFLASAVSVLLYCGVRPLKAPTNIEYKPHLTFFNFLKDSRKNHLGTFILFVSLCTFSVYLISPLYASYMLKDLKFSYMTFTIVLSCEYVARIFSLTFWGRRIDKSGSLRILGIVSYFIPVIPILWIFSGNYLYLCGIQILSGVTWAAFDLSVQAFIYKATPPDQRFRYIVYHRSLTSFSMAVGAITGAFMLNHVFPIFGSQILGMFVVSGLLRLVVTRTMLRKLSLQGIPDVAVNRELAAELAIVPVPFRLGLYYYPDTWKKFTQRVASASSNVIGKAFNTSNISQDGLFYKPAKWAQYMTGAGQRVPIEIRNPNQSVRDSLFYHKEGWAYFQEQNLKGDTPKENNVNISRSGLFNTPQRWREYLKQSLVLNNATTQTSGEGLTLRQPMFYHPEMWQSYQREMANSRVRNEAKVLASRKALLYHPEEWQKYNGQMVINKNKQTSSQIGATINASSRIPVYIRHHLGANPASGIISKIPVSTARASATLA